MGRVHSQIGLGFDLGRIGIDSPTRFRIAIDCVGHGVFWLGVIRPCLREYLFGLIGKDLDFGENKITVGGLAWPILRKRFVGEGAEVNCPDRPMA